MPTSAHRAGRGLIRIAGPIIIVALLVLAVINVHRNDQAVDELRTINQVEHAALIAGCGRGNHLRAQVTRNVTVLAEFIAAAVTARRASGDTKVADRYEQLRAKLKPLQPVDCHAAYPDGPR